MIKYDLNNAGLTRIAEIIHELEIRSWEKIRGQKSEEAEKIDTLIRQIIRNIKSPDECFIQSFNVFDSLYQNFLNENAKVN